MPAPPDIALKEDAEASGTLAQPEEETPVSFEEKEPPSAEDTLKTTSPPQDELQQPLPPRVSITERTFHRARNSFNNVRTRVRMEDLPSHAQKLRSDLTKQFSKSMDHMMRNLNIASQRLNNYTGTDYSGIKGLRSEITAQENLVRASLTAVVAAKSAHNAAFAAQAASQKEVVQLLERKHSWSAADLERYMQLIRNEHINDTTVQDAKTSLALAERKLEDDRTRLEKIERKQYHEEQIWSDTIRRNSTWVTFGLMGFNIILLLLSLLILEPWRRRRMVREIRTALNEKMDNVPAAFAAAAAAAAPSAVHQTLAPAIVPVADNEIASDATVPADSATLEDAHIEATSILPVVVPGEALITADASGPETPLNFDTQPALAPALVTELTTEEIIPLLEERENTTLPTIFPPSAFATTTDTSDTRSDVSTPSPASDTSNSTPPLHFRIWSGSWSSTWTLYKAYWADLFSERHVALRKVDLTATALEGACAGAAAMGLLFVLLRPR